jgi:GNAT superfamily N-acetyltransferase
MTFPSFHHLLALEPTILHPREADQRSIEPLAIGATEGGLPVGLALGALPLKEEGLPELLSVYVVPDHRRRGIGDGLLAGFEEAVRKTRLTRVHTVYMTGKPGTEIFERLIQRRGWSLPVARMIVVKFTLEQAMSTPWYRKYRLRSRFETFPWKNLTEEDLRELKRSQEKTRWIPEDLLPWKHDRLGFEPASSIGARLGGEVVGWVINHQLSSDTVRFTCSFIREDLARRGRIVPLYSESISRMGDTAFTRCMFTVPAQHKEMVAFAKRWCAPWASFLGETRGSGKELG